MRPPLAITVEFVDNSGMKISKSLLESHQGISVDADILGGTPTIRGTRIPVSILLEMLDGGQTLRQIQDQYPHLKEGDIHAAIRFSAEVLAASH